MAEQAIDKVRSSVRIAETTPRVSLTELARSRAWRDQLADNNVVEILQNSDIVAYIVSPECIRAMSDEIDALEQELEDLEIERMFADRLNAAEYKTGKALAKEATRHLDKLVETA